MLEDFLTHHKCGCPENQGRPCTYGLQEARKELRDIRDYLQYVEGKTEIHEVSMTFEQWKTIEVELA